MNKVLGIYKNGNYTVTIFDDGTKIRENDLDNLTPAFAESIDLKITNRCSQKCKFCYENSTTNGKHADLLNNSWIDSLHPYTELAINGNDLDHPQLIEFLNLMKKRHVIVSMTVNSNQFHNNIDKILEFINNKQIYGLGVSVSSWNDNYPLNLITDYNNSVLHLINGLIDEQFVNGHDWKKTKALILGYKHTGRGVKYQHDNYQLIQRNIGWLKNNIVDIIKSGTFKVLSFDNLAIEQLDLKHQIQKHPELGLNWNELYMGDDGQYSFYIDAVSNTFSLNSTISKQERFDIENKTVDEMFNFLRNKYEK